MPNCQNILNINGVSQDTNNYYLVADSTVTPKNGQKFLIVIPFNILTGINSLKPVYVAINNVNYPLLDKCLANNVYTDQIRFINQANCTKYILRVVYGNLQPHFKIISQDLPKTAYGE